MNDLDSRYNEQTLHFLQICMILDPPFKFKCVLDQDTKESLKQRKNMTPLSFALVLAD